MPKGFIMSFYVNGSFLSEATVQKSLTDAEKALVNDIRQALEVTAGQARFLGGVKYKGRVYPKHAAAMLQALDQVNSSNDLKSFSQYWNIKIQGEKLTSEDKFMGVSLRKGVTKGAYKNLQALLNTFVIADDERGNVRPQLLMESSSTLATVLTSLEMKKLKSFPHLTKAFEDYCQAVQMSVKLPPQGAKNKNQRGDFTKSYFSSLERVPSAVLILWVFCLQKSTLSAPEIAALSKRSVGSNVQKLLGLLKKSKSSGMTTHEKEKAIRVFSCITKAESLRSGVKNESEKLFLDYINSVVTRMSVGPKVTVESAHQKSDRNRTLAHSKILVESLGRNPRYLTPDEVEIIKNKGFFFRVI